MVVILVFLRRAFCNKRFFGRSFFVFCQLQQVAGRSQLPPRADPPTGNSLKMTASSMTVAQLKKELEDRGLDASGLKAALVAR